MSTVYSRPQLSLSELRCSPHTTYYTNFFVLRTAVTINGQAAEIVLSENKQLTLNCRYPSTECVSITFHTISSQVEAVLNKYGVSHVSNFWLGEVLFLQVGFFGDQSLKTFLRSQQEMQREVGLLFSARLREGQPSTASVSPVSHGFPVEVETDLFLVLPDAEDKMRIVSQDNYISCLALWKESEKFDFGALFRTFKLKAGRATVKGELSVNVLVSELSDVVDWFHFGLCLGVPPSDLLRNERDRQFNMERLIHMLNWWVKNGEQPTWSAVVRALFGIRMRGLAEKIAVKYAVPLSPQMAVSTTADSHPIHFTAAESQTVSIQLPVNIQRMYSNLEEKDEELTKISESLTAAKERMAAASRKHTEIKKQLTVSQVSKETLLSERDAARSHLEVEEGELKFLKHLQKIEKRNDELQTIITKKERKITQLKEQLANRESELNQARKEIHKLTKELQQTTMELADRSGAQVREMQRARAGMERERSRADMMIMQLFAMNQLERVVPAQLDTLQQAVKDKEEEVGRLSSELEAKETEKQKLLVEVERQNQQDELEDQLVQLIGEVCELRANLMEAEDRKMMAQVELKDLNSKKGVINQPALQNCKAVGLGLQYGEINQIAQFQVHLTDANGEACIERQEVRAELKSLVDGSITQAEVSHQTRSVCSYEVSYQPSIRGRHKLSVLVNGEAIAGSPFGVYVQQPPQSMGQPVRVIVGLRSPWRAKLNSSGHLIVTEDFCRVSVFDDQSKLLHRIEAVELEQSRVKLDPTGVAFDDSGTMYVCDVNAHKLVKVSTTGKVLKSVGGRGSDPGQFDYPDGITLKDSKLYVCDQNNHRIQVYSCDLNFISCFGSRGSGEGEFINPVDIAFDKEGNMYVVEFGNHRVQVFSSSGIFLRSFSKHSCESDELSRPNGICVDHNIAYITDDTHQCVSLFTTLGEFITSFGRLGSNEGEFNRPHGITMDHDGYLYVCDCWNDRIQIF